MEKPEIIIKESVLNKLVAIIIFFALIFIMIVKSDRNFFEREQSDQNLIILIIFGLLILLFLLSCIKIFDENPTLKINERGVWYRSGYIPFSPLKLLEWNKIDFVELNIVSYSKHRKGKGLIIYKKNSLSTKTIYLDDLDCPNEDILSIFKKHSNFLNYINRSEIKNTCRY